MPLLIGGATTSPGAHLGEDRSAVPVARGVREGCLALGRCLSDAHHSRRSARRSSRKNDAEHERRREQHAGKKVKAPELSLAQARANRRRIDWAASAPSAPRAPGMQLFDDYPLSELSRYIDWMPFFNAWEFAGQFPDILTDPLVGEAASNLYADAREHAEAADRRALAAGARGGRLVSGQRGRRRRRGLRRRARAQRAVRPCASCASRRASRRASRTSAWPTTSRPSRAACATISARSRSPPASASRSTSRASSAPTTTIRASC